jgi:hypothetical protein
MDHLAMTNTFAFGSQPIQVPNYTAWDHFRKPLGMAAQGRSWGIQLRCRNETPLCTIERIRRYDAEVHRV